MQTYSVSKIMHQNIAKILWQFNYSKNSFIPMVTGVVVTQQQCDQIGRFIGLKATF